MSSPPCALVIRNDHHHLQLLGAAALRSCLGLPSQPWRRKRGQTSCSEALQYRSQCIHAMAVLEQLVGVCKHSLSTLRHLRADTTRPPLSHHTDPASFRPNSTPFAPSAEGPSRSPRTG